MRYAAFILLGCLLFCDASGAGRRTVTLSISGPSTVCQGTSAAFHATLSGFTGTPTYRWMKNGLVVHSNARTPDSSVLETSILANGDVITCASEGATSNSLTVTISAPQTFSLGGIAPPMFQCSGTFITLTAESNLPATYAWKFNGTAIAGADSATHVVLASSLAQLQGFSVAGSCSAACVSNPNLTYSYAGYSFDLTASVTPAIAISASPGAALCSGTAVSFSATVTNGGTAPQYAWKLNGSTVSTASTYSESTPASGQQVDCVLASNATCATSTTATSNTLTLSVTPVGTIGLTISGPDTICQAGSAFFHAMPTNEGTATLTYQWQKNGVNVHSDIVTPDSSVYGSDRLTNGSVIDCIVSTNAACFTGPVTSNSLTIGVTQPQPFSVGLFAEGMFYCPGRPVIFNASASDPVSDYRWYENGTLISGATTSEYTLPAATLALLQGLSVSVDANGGCLTAYTATASESGHTFQQASYVVPSVAVSEASTMIGNAPQVTFTASDMYGGVSPGYLWQVNGVTVQQGGATYTPTGLTAGVSYQIVCTMTPSSDVCVNPSSVCVSLPYYSN